ncbi:MAG: hypothetical protein LBT87_01690 [Treponema sp.]|nr:hypothetical protein [Treponema sp.]
MRIFLTVFSLSLAPLDFGISAQEAGISLLSEKWYVSNAGGMALEPAPSRLAALRNRYSLMIGRTGPRELPDLLRKYYQAPWAIELRALYDGGVESRRQWIFLDGALTRLVAVFVEPPPPEDGDTADGESAAPPEDRTEEAGESGKGEAASPTGFIEVYNGEGFLTEERRFQDQGEEIGVRYFFNRRILIRSETTRKPPPDLGTGDSPGGEDAGNGERAVMEGPGPGEPAGTEGTGEPGETASLPPAAPADPKPPAPPVERLVCTDYYRYSRSGSLRAIERVYHEPREKASLRFPLRMLDSVYEKEFVNPAIAYGSDFLSDIFMDSDYRVVYNTDQRGRILSETHLDADGQVVGELRNTWAQGRLAQITWKAGEEDRRIEFVYNADGDRIEERNYQKENLERVVFKEGDVEVEELYMNGQPILRARWENGRKVSEERIRPPASGSGR